MLSRSAVSATSTSDSMLRTTPSMPMHVAAQTHSIPRNIAMRTGFVYNATIGIDEDLETFMNGKNEIATTRFVSGYNCAQAVVNAFREETGLDEDTGLKIATGLGAGMARQQEVCGAVTGGILVLGLLHGRGSKDDRSATERTYSITRELMNQFAAKRGSCLCRELLPGYDLATQEGFERARADGMFNKVCLPCVQTVVEILETIQQDQTRLPA